MYADVAGTRIFLFNLNFLLGISHIIMVIRDKVQIQVQFHYLKMVTRELLELAKVELTGNSSLIGNRIPRYSTHI